MCQKLEVSRSGYYEHTHKVSRPRRQQDQAIALRLVEGFKPAPARSAQNAGPWREPQTHQPSDDRPGPGTKSQAPLRAADHSQQSPCPIAANLLQQRDAPPAHINEVWVKDITYIPTGEGWLYLDATLDLYSRRVLGWHAATTMPAGWVIHSLRQAYRNRGVPLHGLIVHTDRGCQYASVSYRADLRLLHAIPSMSRKGNCYDNAAMAAKPRSESFWARLKTRPSAPPSPPPAPPPLP